MNKLTTSSNEKVNKFLNDFAETFPESHEIVQTVRKIIGKQLPSADEDIKYGGIVFLQEDYLVTGIFVRKSHISVEFTDGAGLNDPEKMLEGTGKLRRHIKLRSINDIETKHVSEFIKQCK